MAEEREASVMSNLRGLVLAPFGRDAVLLGGALTDCGGDAFICRTLDELLAQMRSGRADLLIVSDDAFTDGGDARLLSALRDQAADSQEVLPLVLLTGSTELVHPLTRFPGVVVIAKPTRRRILDSVLRGAMDTRRHVQQLRTMTDELGSRNFALADALQARDRFVSTMSHELRTPLNAVLSYADLLDLEINGPLNDKQRAHVRRIVASGQHLLELIGEVLDVSKLSAGQLRVEPCPIDLPREVGDAILLVAPEADFPGLQLSVQPPTEPLPPALADRLRVRQVLLNLLSNAIKFTNQGGVTVRFERDGDHAVSVLVEDTGIGIAPDHLPRLFDDFYQVDNGLARKHDGSGLGLAIARRLALLMGGDLSAASQLGHGSVFTFTLPLATELRDEGPAHETKRT